MHSPERPAFAPAFTQVFTRVFPRNPNTHWLNIAAMLADAAFETDAAGRFTAFGQSTVFGFPAAVWVGKNLSEFCRQVGSAQGPGFQANGFGAVLARLNRQSVAWRGLVVLKRADGSEGSYQIILAPRFGEEAKNRKPGPAEIIGTFGLLIGLAAPELLPPASRAESRLDPETGLWTAAAFADEARRRFDRLDVEGLPGTLLLLGFARTPMIGHKAVAERLTQELRDVSRPTDILGRIDGTTFALWCDGMDDLTGGERAARFCQRLPLTLPGTPCISVGLVARWPGGADDPQTLINHAGAALAQADRAAQDAKDAGSMQPVINGTWRVWNPQF